VDTNVQQSVVSEMAIGNTWCLLVSLGAYLWLFVAIFFEKKL